MDTRVKSSPGTTMAILGGLVGVISFFLPWVSYSFGSFSYNISGFDIARLTTQYVSVDNSYTILWVVPIAAVGLFVAAGLYMSNRQSGTLTAARVAGIVGLLDMIYIFYKFSQGTGAATLLRYAGIGFWVGLIGAVVGAIGAFIARPA